MKILVINGPNLNMLGTREPEIYGNKTHEDLNYIVTEGKKLDVHVDVIQSNIEGEIINAIHKAQDNYYGIVANFGAFTHYSYAIYDAIKSQPLPVVEVHISNIHARDEFRSKSVTAGACVGIISGFDFLSYALGLKVIVDKTYQKMDVARGSAPAILST